MVTEGGKMKLIQLVLVLFIGRFAVMPVVKSEEIEEQPKIVIIGELPRLVVQDVVPESPADKAGILPKDIIVQYDGKLISTQKELNELRQQVQTDSVEVVIVRGGQEMRMMMPSGTLGVYLNELLPDIKYKADAKVIEGIPKLGWDVGRSNSFFAALEAIANYLGIKKTYLLINGLSGGAFRLQFHNDWCPSSPDPTCGFNAGEEALRVLGLEYQVLHIAKDSSNRDEMKKAILASIDNNKPVLAIDMITTAEWGVITGYQNNGDELLCRTFFDRRDGYEIAQKFPWALYIITGRIEVPQGIDPYKKSFAIALKNLKTEKIDAYYSGLAAFDKWILRLEQDDFAALDSAKFDNACLANAWIYDRLTDDRQNAADYLDRIALLFPHLHDRLKALAKIYREESELLGKPKGIVIYPFDMKSRDDWGAEMRANEVGLLRQAKAKEEAALRLWGVIAKTIGR